MSNKDDIILYDYPGSPCARRVKISLIEKGVPFRIQEIDLSKMQQKSPDYLAINPNGLVPALNHNGQVLFESSVINDYLEDQFPEIPLLATTTQGRIDTQYWQNQELAMAKIYRPLMYARTMGPLNRIACTKDEFLSIARKATQNMAHLAWEEKVWDLAVLPLQEQAIAQKKIGDFANQVERHLENKDYLVENRFTLADICLYPRMAMFGLVGIDINPFCYPNVSRWMESIKSRESFVSTQSELEKRLERLNKIGLLTWINRVSYQSTPLSIGNKILLSALRPLLRKALKIDDALQPSSSNLPDIITPSITERPLAKSTISNKCATKTSSQACGGDEQFVFYGYPNSPICQRIEWILKATGIPYQYNLIDMSQQEHKTTAYTHLNPTQELPLLLDKNTPIIDSLFIAEYLDSLSESLDLFSNESITLAEIRLWNAFDMGLHKEFGTLFHHKIGSRSASTQEREIACALLKEKMSLFENQLTNEDATRKPQFLVSDRLTYADLIMLTRMQGIRFVAGDSFLDDYPAIKTWETFISSRTKSLIDLKKKGSPKSGLSKSKSSATA